MRGDDLAEIKNGSHRSVPKRPATALRWRALMQTSLQQNGHSPTNQNRAHAWFVSQQDFCTSQNFARSIARNGALLPIRNFLLRRLRNGTAKPVASRQSARPTHGGDLVASEAPVGEDLIDRRARYGWRGPDHRGRARKSRCRRGLDNTVHLYERSARAIVIVHRRFVDAEYGSEARSVPSNSLHQSSRLRDATSFVMRSFCRCHWVTSN